LKRKGSSHNFGELIFACVALVNRDRAKNSPLASATHASNNLDAPETQQGGAGLLRFLPTYERSFPRLDHLRCLGEVSIHRGKIVHQQSKRGEHNCARLFLIADAMLVNVSAAPRH
jgi:hypothetical protein